MTIHKRAVQFDDTKNQTKFFEREDACVDELWLSQYEFQTIKDNGRASAREFRRRGHSNLLNGVFASPVSSAEQQIVAYCCLSGPLCPRGLERYCNRQLSEERADCKDQARQQVLDAQNTYKSCDYNELSAILASIYRIASEDSAVFALRMGKADAKAATQTTQVTRAAMRRRSSGYSSVHSVESLDSLHRSPRRQAVRCPVVPRKQADDPLVAGVA